MLNRLHLITKEKNPEGKVGIGRVNIHSIPFHPKSPPLEFNFGAVIENLNQGIQKLAPADAGDTAVTEGFVVVKRDARNIGTFERIYRDGEPLATNESRVHYRIRKRDVRIVTNAYFFQEGTAGEYSKARFGELRVAANGDALLTGMRDKDLNLLGTSKKS